MTTIRHFIKTNWFPVAILLLLLIAAMRRKIRLPVDLSIPAIGKEEKYTQSKGSALAHSSRMGLLPDGSGSRVAMPEIPDAEAEAFLRRFSKVAMSERKKFGLPASVILAHAYVNSFAGRRKTAAEANNFTALICGGDWDGATVDIDGQCFRQYNTPWESYRDFSIFLAGRDWVAETRAAGGSDWKAWIAAFERHGLSDVAGYAGHMEAIILSYRLFELDE
jgi:flagellum-specific peptidoglycan hydrolase FlgJ